MSKMVNGKFGVVAATLVAFGVPMSVSAGEVELTFVDHQIVLVGEYTGMQGNAYIVETRVGTVVVPVSMVTCSGADCALEEGGDA